MSVQFTERLSFKLIVPTVLILSTTIGVFYLLFRENAHSLIKNFSEKRAFEIAELISLNVETNTKSNNLSRVISSIGSYDDVDTVFVIDDKLKRIITSNKNIYRQKDIEQIEDRALQALLIAEAQRPTTHYEHHHTEDIWNETSVLTYKINAISEDKRSLRPLTLILVLDEKSLTEALFSFLTPLMAIQVTGLLIAGLCFYFSARFFIFFPLIQLIHNINVARSSKQTIQVTHSSKGEIGLLIDRYNELMESLGKHQKELIEAKEKSETAAKAKSEFLATMTHELRTPLNGVIGISALLKQLNLDKKQEYYVDVINQSGSQLLSIINDILDFSKIESGNLELSNITFNLPQMVQQVSTLMEVQAAQKSLEFSYIDTIDQPDTMIFADDTRLRQVLINLLGNAIKFTQEGHIHIALSKDDTPLPKLDPSRSSFPFKVTISDTGIGLTQNQMDKLFERFTQADASTTRKFGGTGLGLAICKNICDKMEGKIEVTSQPNEGTVFTVRFNLPLADESKQEEQRYSLENALVPFSNQRSIDAIEALWNEHPLSETPERLKVLVVDDTFINLQIAASLIESEGIRVTTAEDGIQAIDAIYRDDFDLILMDCLMPKMDGYQATQSIRARENELNLARTPVIALTASALQETKEKCMAADMDDFVSKPFDSQLLISTIKWWLTKSYGLNENK